MTGSRAATAPTQSGQFSTKNVEMHKETAMWDSCTGQQPDNNLPVGPTRQIQWSQGSHHKYTQRTGGSQLKKWRETKEKKAGRQKWMEILSSSAVTEEEKAPESQQSGSRRRTNMQMGSQNQKWFMQYAEQTELVRECEQSL